MTARTEKRCFATRPADPDSWIKAGFQRGITVADMLRDLLAREFPDIGGDRP